MTEKLTGERNYTKKFERDQDLKAQSLEFNRKEADEQHNVHSGITRMHTLSIRRNRRMWNRDIKAIREGWNGSHD